MMWHFSRRPIPGCVCPLTSWHHVHDVRRRALLLYGSKRAKVS